MFLQSSYNTLILFFFLFLLFFFLHSVPYAYDNKLSSMMTKLNAWSVETRAPWERNGGRVSVLRVGNQNTVRKKSRCARSTWQPVRLRLCPCSRNGKGERDKVRGQGSALPLFSFARAWIWWQLPPPPPPFSPLHSVLSSRCQEVAQCLFFFFFWKVACFHTSCFNFSFVLRSWRSRLVVKEFQVGLCVFLCLILSPVPGLSF